MVGHGTDIEMHALFNETAHLSPLHNPYRGYCLLNTKDTAANVQVKRGLLTYHSGPAEPGYTPPLLTV